MICTLAAEFWLESQCFETFFNEHLAQLEAQNAEASRLLLAEILASMKMLVQACEKGDDDDSRLENDEHSRSESQGDKDSLNHKAFKTV